MFCCSPEPPSGPSGGAPLCSSLLLFAPLCSSLLLSAPISSSPLLSSPPLLSSLLLTTRPSRCSAAEWHHPRPIRELDLGFQDIFYCCFIVYAYAVLMYMSISCLYIYYRPAIGINAKLNKYSIYICIYAVLYILFARPSK